MATVELSIDLGSKFITIYQKGIGLVLCEPALVIATMANHKTELREAGYRAQSIMADSLGGARVMTPIKEGVVVDEETAAMMLKYFLKKIIPSSIIPPTIKAIVSICSSSSGSDRRAVEKCCLKAGIKEVTLVEAPLSLLAYTGSIGGLIVDIGGGKTEIAAVTNRGIAAGCSVNIAGDAFNNAIIDRMFSLYGVKVGEYTVENLKQSALSFYANDASVYSVMGSGKDGSPRSIDISAVEMQNAVIPLMDDILEVVMSVLNQAPPELVAEVKRKGMFLTGGSVHIPGIKEYIEYKLDLEVILLRDNENAVAIGGAQFFDNKELLGNMLGIKLK